jgi:NAD(P)-dependent dehydrogenase (short-subunit alcohol dehydrogenase family)
MKKLENKIAVITGPGSGGIGAEIALEFARNGAHLALLDMNVSGCNSLSECIQKLGQKSLPLKVDTSNYQEVWEAFRLIEDQYKRIDILMNCAMKIKYDSFLQLSPENWGANIRTGLDGYFYCSQAAARIMVERKIPGKIVHISSVAARGAHPRSAGYAAAKGGVGALTRVMAFELSSYHINVNAISPGPVMTPGLRNVLNDEELELRRKHVPWGRLGQPLDIARLALFLVSDDAEFITGQEIIIDGGFVLK